MVTICPTVTASEPHSYRTQLERLEPFAKRLHIDLADGRFAPRQLIDADKIWWPKGTKADIHLMYQHPEGQLKTLLDLRPHLIILQAEAQGTFLDLARRIQDHDVKVGLALLPATEVEVIAPAIQAVQHVLIFSGNLGYQGGSTADLGLLRKVEQLKSLKPELEIGWDGGINEQNVHKLAATGIDILNVGGFIQSADDAAAAYAKLKAAI